MTSIGGYKSRSNSAKLFSTTDSDTDPEGLITNFLKYELARLHRPRGDFLLDGPLSERLKVLQWYLRAYGHHRKGEVRIPLSNSQLNYLNSPAPIAGAKAGVTIAFYNFLLVDFSAERCGDLNNPVELQKLIYWWCLQRLPELGLEDRLVTPDHIALLRSDGDSDGQRYPLNVFMKQYVLEHSELDWLDLFNPVDRAALHYLLVLQSFSDPHIARFLPKETWNKGVAATFKNESRSFLELLLEKHSSCTSAQSTELIRQGGAVLRRYGFSFKSGWKLIQSPAGDTGTCFEERWSLGGPIQVGVNVVGPMLSTSGLGQATRLSLEALKSCESAEPATTLFSFDNPAPIGFASEVNIQTPAAKREINLIHLNAESIPLAFAYLPRTLYEESYNIGYFFWELDKIPDCHYLALDMLDEIWVSSEYNRETYSKYTTIPVVNVGMAVEPITDVVKFDRSRLEVKDSTFVFLMVFDSFSFVERKNPSGVISAFSKAFPLGSEDVSLCIKTQNRSRVRDPYQMKVWAEIDRAMLGDPRIKVIDETYKYSELLGIKLASDCYVSLHRSEGWGFGMIEAMQLGRPVICTAYSGSNEFCNEETAFLVDYELAAPLEEEYIFVPRGSQWANPSTPAAAARMIEVSQNRELAACKGKTAKEFIAERFGIQAIGRRYANRLSKVREIIESSGKKGNLGDVAPHPERL